MLTRNYCTSDFVRADHGFRLSQRESLDDAFRFRRKSIGWGDDCFDMNDTFTEFCPD